MIESAGMKVSPCIVCKRDIVKGEWYDYAPRHGNVHVDCLPDADIWVKAAIEANQVNPHPHRVAQKFKRWSPSQGGRDRLG